MDHLLAARVDHALYVNEPIGAEDDAFARIADPHKVTSDFKAEIVAYFNAHL